MRWCRSPCCPIIIFTLVRQSASENGAWRRFGRQALALVLAVGAIVSAEAIATEHYFPLGRVDRATYLMWDDIGRNTRYQDVVVSPVLEANPDQRAGRRILQARASRQGFCGSRQARRPRLRRVQRRSRSAGRHRCRRIRRAASRPRWSTPGEFACCGLRTIRVIGSAAPRLGITSAHVWHRRHLSSRRA